MMVRWEAVEAVETSTLGEQSWDGHGQATT